MLYQITLIVDLLAMATTLWMAFYLFARGFPSQMTLRAVIVMAVLSLFFYGAYNNVLSQLAGTAPWRAVLLVVGMASWYSLTVYLMPDQSSRRYRVVGYILYSLAAITIFLLLRPNSFINEQGNAIYVAHMSAGPASAVYGIYQVAIAVSILFNMLVDQRVGLTSMGRYFFVASIFPSISVVYGVLALTSPTPWPRIVPDFLIFLGVFIIGLSVARHQTLIERRTTLQDFPVSTLVVLSFSALYAYLARLAGLPAELTASVVALAIITHAAYDLTREFLERLRERREGAFRKELRLLESQTAGEDAFNRRLQSGLDLLLNTMNSSGGMVAVRRGEGFIVSASQSSVPIGTELAQALVACEEASRPSDVRLDLLVWIVPSFEGQTQVAVLGVGKSKSRTEYSQGHMELLAEVADQIGTLVSLHNAQPVRGEQLRELVAESQAYKKELRSVSVEIMDTLNSETTSEFIRVVEEGLRHLPDAISLGQSSLAEKLAVEGGSHVERGKRLQQILTDSIELLRPAEKRPPEPLPRAWYNHAVLYDAYVEGVPNREIMARLYVSEGTFNRTRRNAIRGLARLLIERA